MKLINKYLLIRANKRNKNKVVIFQSDRKEEVQRVKGEVESQVELDFYNDHLFFIEDVEKTSVGKY